MKDKNLKIRLVLNMSSIRLTLEATTDAANVDVLMFVTGLQHAARIIAGKGWWES